MLHRFGLNLELKCESWLKREELPQTHRIAFIEITRLDMLQCCEARQDPSDKLQKAIRQTLTDSGHLSEIPPHWLELAAATLSSAKVNCLPPQSKEPILSFATSRDVKFNCSRISGNSSV